VLQNGLQNETCFWFHDVRAPQRTFTVIKQKSATLEAHEGPVHITPEKSENGVFTLKTHQMFSVHTTPRKLKNATIIGHFRFAFEEKSGN